MKKLSKEKIFDYNSKELLGIMRFDFYDGSLANSWNERELIKRLKEENKIYLKVLQLELNEIQFELIKSYEEVIKLCDGEGYDNETLLYIECEKFKYVIKLVPVRDNYSYIYAYKKE
ncbi:hypothetical protein [Clostridium baratii]|uniref:hypothetical protein n=1 Tax=Clostridium baratii TaxID=1561 RepID=UPI001C025C6F|nr:hypothetical protein [Clostridium baratii]MBT9830300.1 hypothetical protein [Clostridium baratii]